jgi:hypothetical protein
MFNNKARTIIGSNGNNCRLPVLAGFVQQNLYATPFRTLRIAGAFGRNFDKPIKDEKNNSTFIIHHPFWVVVMTGTYPV